MKRFAVELSTGYANLCDAVVAPSESIAAILRDRGVDSPITVIPTGVDLAEFGAGDGLRFRRAHGIPEGAFLAGHLGRLAPEKNLEFLARAVARFLRMNEKAHFLAAGSGPSAETLDRIFRREAFSGRYHRLGILTGRDRADAYRAMDVFAFASRTETQGMVLTEAQAAGVPVVALDAPGAREVVRDGETGRLLNREEAAAFARALAWTADLPPDRTARLKAASEQNAARFSRDRSARSAIGLYESLIRLGRREREAAGSPWGRALDLLGAEWTVWANRVLAARTALS